MSDSAAKTYRKLGIIGGMGPAAGVRLQQRIIDFTCANTDQDHIPMLAYTQPAIPDRTAYLLGRPGAEPFVEPLTQVALELESCGCEVIAMACNTAHAAYTDVASALSTATLLNMLDETARFMVQLECTRVAILATDGTLATGVYRTALESHELAYICPDESIQRSIMSLIYDGVKAGRPVEPEELERCITAMIGDGIDGAILGCTELSCIPHASRIAGIPVVDALDVLAWRCVVESGAPAYSLYSAFDKE